MKKMKWTVIGAGGIADRRAIPALLSDPENEIVAIMDKNERVAKAIAEKYGIGAWFTNVEEMFKATPCDAVYIGTPVFIHKEQATLALKYGINVFMEKPITLTAKEGEELLAAFRKAKKQLTIGYMMGYHNLHKRARDIVKAGGIGSPVSARFQFSCWYPDIEGAWRQKKALGGGGCIMDLAVHCMELFSSVVGEEIADAKALFNTKTFNYEVEDSAAIVFISEAGTLGTIDVNFNIPDNAAVSKFELYGTAGSLIAEGTLGQEEVGRLKYIFSPQGEYSALQERATEKPRTYKAKGENIYAKQFADFKKKVMKEKRCYKNAKRAVAIQRICDKLYSENL